MKTIAFVIPALLLIVSMNAQSQSFGNANYTSAQASQIINSTWTYVNTINQSSYLIFYPNLNASYQYLNQSQGVYKTSPNLAVAYAYLAKKYADKEYARIGTYRNNSLIVMLIFSVIMLAAVYLVMKPVAKEQRKKHKRVNRS